jgi:hypothetical protein
MSSDGVHRLIGPIGEHVIDAMAIPIGQRPGGDRPLGRSGLFVALFGCP